MAKNIKKLNYRFDYKDKTVEGVMHINLQRFEGQYQKAQYELDSMVMTSMIPYMPKVTGTFINVTQGMSQSLAGTGVVVAAAPPMGRYLYEGKKMVDSVTGKGPRHIKLSSGEVIFRFRKGAQLQPTTENLDFEKSANPEVQAHWFDAAKKDHGEAWVEKTKELAGGK